jgi:hypothetical protein
MASAARRVEESRRTGSSISADSASLLRAWWEFKAQVFL